MMTMCDGDEESGEKRMGEKKVFFPDDFSIFLYIAATPFYGWPPLSSIRSTSGSLMKRGERETESRESTRDRDRDRGRESKRDRERQRERTRD